MADPIFLKKVRLSFPKLIEAQSMQDFPNSPKKFGADFIMSAEDEGYKRFMAEVGKIAGEKWKEHARTVLQMIQTDRLKRCYGNGSEKVDKATMKVINGYEGMVFLSANSPESDPPQMIRLDGTICDNENTMERMALARKLYGGCYVNVAVRPWCQDNQYGRGIRNQLLAVQFAGDGEPFGESRPDVSGLFGAVAVPQAPVPEFADKLPWM